MQRFPAISVLKTDADMSLNTLRYDAVASPQHAGARSQFAPCCAHLALWQNVFTCTKQHKQCVLFTAFKITTTSSHTTTALTTTDDTAASHNPLSPPLPSPGQQRCCQIGQAESSEDRNGALSHNNAVQ